MIRISFRKGGDKAFYSVLRRSLLGKAWEVRVMRLLYSFFRRLIRCCNLIARARRSPRRPLSLLLLDRRLALWAVPESVSVCSYSENHGHHLFNR